MYLTNKYSRWYYNIIKNSKNRILTAYSERHHIIPRSLGGNDSLENIAIHTPMHTICRNELYTGAGGPNYDNTIYYFQHKNGMFEQCTKYELFTKYNLTRNGIYAMCDGTQKTSQGWSLQAR